MPGQDRTTHPEYVHDGLEDEEGIDGDHKHQALPDVVQFLRAGPVHVVVMRVAAGRSVDV